MKVLTRQFFVRHRFNAHISVKIPPITIKNLKIRAVTVFEVISELGNKILLVFCGICIIRKHLRRYFIWHQIVLLQWHKFSLTMASLSFLLFFSILISYFSFIDLVGTFIQVRIIIGGRIRTIASRCRVVAFIFNLGIVDREYAT